MKKTIIKNTIYEFENFLTLEEQEYLLRIANDPTPWDGGNNEYWKEKTKLVSSEIMLNLDKKVASIFDNTKHIDPINRINRFLPGHDMGIHSDEVGNEKIQYGVVIYINENFVGGEICYPTLDYIHKPKARSLIAHPGSLPHLVNPVNDGPIRYSITTFVHGEKTNPVRIK